MSERASQARQRRAAERAADERLREDQGRSISDPSLELWLGGELVATTVSVSRGAKMRLVYTDGANSRFAAETPLLSCSLPTPGPCEPARSRAFLEGLLPEGEALRAAAAQVREVRLASAGVPETPFDVVRLLAEYGRECAGAVVALPAGSAPPGAGRYELLVDDELADIVRGLPQHPLGTDLSRNIRMSLAGAQPKFLLALVDGRWHEPIDGAPSTHIVKPTTMWPDSARNEALVMNLARGCGLTHTEAWTETMGDSEVLVVERYDRIQVDGRIARIHQEDMCQAVGIRPSAKYEIGRPSERMARVLREFTDTPRVHVRELFRQVAFRIVVGDEDGHGKNYSLLLQDGVVTLAPMYDSLCTLVYPQLSGRMATRVGAQQSLAKVDHAALIEEARAMGIPQSEAEQDLSDLVHSLRDATANLDDSLTTGWRSERVLDTITTRIDRLEQRLPLGGNEERPELPVGTLDQQTSARRTG